MPAGVIHAERIDKKEIEKFPERSGFFYADRSDIFYAEYIDCIYVINIFSIKN